MRLLWAVVLALPATCLPARAENGIVGFAVIAVP